jgi:hypothetical protein
MIIPTSILIFSDGAMCVLISPIGDPMGDGQLCCNRP